MAGKAKVIIASILSAITTYEATKLTVIKDLQKQIAGLHAQQEALLKQRANTLQKTQEYNDATAKLEAFRKTTEQKEQEITSYLSEINSLKDSIKVLAKNLENAQQQLEKSERDKSMSAEKLLEHEKTIKDQAARINGLMSQLDTATKTVEQKQKEELARLNENLNRVSARIQQKSQEVIKQWREQPQSQQQEPKTTIKEQQDSPLPELTKPTKEPLQDIINYKLPDEPAQLSKEKIAEVEKYLDNMINEAITHFGQPTFWKKNKVKEALERIKKAVQKNDIKQAELAVQEALKAIDDSTPLDKKATDKISFKEAVKAITPYLKAEEAKPQDATNKDIQVGMFLAKSAAEKYLALLEAEGCNNEPTDSDKYKLFVSVRTFIAILQMEYDNIGKLPYEQIKERVLDAWKTIKPDHDTDRGRMQRKAIRMFIK